MFSLDDLGEMVEKTRRLTEATKIVLPQLDAQTRVEVGQKLWNLSRLAAMALEPIKTSLRDEAVKRRKGASGTVQFTAPDGSKCSVNIPTPSLGIRRGTDMRMLKNLLGDQFDDLFETITTYKPRGKLQAKTAALADPDHRKTVLESLDVNPGTPRVFFEDT